MTSSSGTPAPPDASLGYLLGRVALLELVALRALAERGAGDGEPRPNGTSDGRFLSDDYVAWLLDRPGASPGTDGAGAEMSARLEADTDRAEERGVDIRLRRLSRAFGLTTLEQDLLVVALSPALDGRLGRLFALLDDGPTGGAAVSLAVQLARGGTGPADPRDWLALTDGSALVDGGLVEVAGAGVPLPARSVRVPERVAAFLLGDDRPDALLAEHLRVAPALPRVDPALTALGRPRTIHLTGRPGTDPASEASAWVTAAGATPLVVEPPDPAADPGGDVLADVLRECLLTGCVPVVGPVDATVQVPSGRARLARVVDRLPVAVVWSTTPTLAWSTEPLPSVTLAVPPVAHRTEVWGALCTGLGTDPTDLALLAQHRVGGAGAHRAVRLARAFALPDRVPGRPELEAALRAQDAVEIHGQVRRLTPRRSWGDLVLPAPTERRLRELVALVRHRDAVVDEWGLGRGGGSRGVCALFAGRSGTGKTLAAEVIAHELGVDLCTIDLAQVVSKWVGETEKNLDAVLSAAEGASCVLFFDEADALFGKRGEIRGGQDRYANLEVSYLLQRIEAAGAVVVLATNLRSQVDEAFLRRVDAFVELTEPGPGAREAIWAHHLARVPVDPVADVGFCARTFELTGGSIRNAVVAAACFAAEDGHPVGTAELVRALEREFEKLGRLRVRTDFGPYAHLLEARP
ncbi:ATP-binding protein [Actinotalea sp. K2]|uniref:ATP-binding protein n=1 Tax=Actinotalea sp. K2 TaxID=2939438 RepID=UPI002017D6FD|nr:ATP-binding protein [Actinotalea sp. K2]MCL3860428.1 ATP-binding protein [Actinotalea sp. K2]